MPPVRCVSTLRTVLSEDDWQLIVSAIGAYTHNTRYRDLLNKLERLAATNGASVPEQDLSTFI